MRCFGIAYFILTMGFAEALNLPCLADPMQMSRSHIVAALENIKTLDRPGQDGLATIWDGNKYIQCQLKPDRSIRCEAAGLLLQPSLSHVLKPDRITRLSDLGWHLDSSFGNFVQTFPPALTSDKIADFIIQALVEAYGVTVEDLEVKSDWIKSQPCPPRNGFTQNLAGIINDAPEMAKTAIHTCAYKPESGNEYALPIHSASDLILIYGTRVASEIQRLRVNQHRYVFFVLSTQIGYVQCQPASTPDTIYCEAQSADSWPALTSVLTTERVELLHKAGFTDPGRVPNYWKLYPSEQFDDASIAHELLTVLYDIYGYRGQPKLEIANEKGK